jgi:bifunctional non-homologous end joining protein LigD
MAVAEKARELSGVRLTHPSRVLYPDCGLTKEDLARYYVDIADHLLPHVVDRPLSIVRCPDGRDEACFYQKHLSAGMPRSIRPMRLKESGGYKQYVSIRDVDGLVALVQFGVLEIHPWGCAPGKIEVAERIVFDLDPDPTVKWPRVVAAAKDVRQRLSAVGLESFLKTTGGKGLHVVAPLSPPMPWAPVKAFAQAFSAQMVAETPEEYIAKSSKSARRGKIFVDYLRNDRGATSVAPYSTRAKPGATVSMPLAWSELSTRMRSYAFTVTNTRQRLKRLKRDPWRDFFKIRQNIDPKLFE